MYEESDGLYCSSRQHCVSRSSCPKSERPPAVVFDKKNPAGHAGKPSGTLDLAGVLHSPVLPAPVKIDVVMLPSSATIMFAREDPTIRTGNLIWKPGWGGPMFSWSSGFHENHSVWHFVHPGLYALP